MRFGFNGPAYLSPTPLADAELLINWRPQKVESPNARVAYALLRTSGTQLFVDLSVAAGAKLPSVRGFYAVSGRCFAVAGTHLLEIFASGEVTDYGGQGTANNNIADDGLDATMTSAGTVGPIEPGAPESITGAAILSPTYAQVNVLNNEDFAAGQSAVVAGITNSAFKQLNGTWMVYDVIGDNTVGLTTSGLTVEAQTALNAGTITPPASAGTGSYPSQLLIASGGNLTVFSLISNSFQPLTTPPTQVLMVDFLDGFFIALSAGNVWSVSNPEDATTWPGIAVSQVSVFSDQLLGIVASNRLLWVFGAKRAVGYYNSGAALFPFDVASGAFMEVGLAAQFSPARVATHAGTTIMWLSADERGANPVVYAANGFIPQRVSDSGLEYWMSQQTSIADAVGIPFSEEGQNFYGLWFPSANAFWVLDADLGWWHRRSSRVNGVDGASLWRCHVAALGMNLVGDRTSGKVYKLSTAFFTDNGAPIIRTRQGPTISNEGGQIPVPINEFQVDFETGMGPIPPLTDGFGNPRDPVAMFSYSEDYGKTFTPEREIPCGQAGNFKVVAIDRRLGSWRSWTPKVVVSDPIAWAISDAYVNGTQDNQDRLAKSLLKIT